MDLYQRLKQIYDSVPGRFKEHSSVDSAIAWMIANDEAENISDLSQKEVADMYFSGIKPLTELTPDELIAELNGLYPEANDAVDAFINFYINDKTESDEEDDEP